MHRWSDVQVRRCRRSMRRQRPRCLPSRAAPCRPSRPHPRSIPPRCRRAGKVARVVVGVHSPVDGGNTPPRTSGSRSVSICGVGSTSMAPAQRSVAVIPVGTAGVVVGTASWLPESGTVVNDSGWPRRSWAVDDHRWPRPPLQAPPSAITSKNDRPHRAKASAEPMLRAAPHGPDDVAGMNSSAPYARTIPNASLHLAAEPTHRLR